MNNSKNHATCPDYPMTSDLLFFLQPYLVLLGAAAGWLVFRKLYGAAGVAALLLAVHFAGQVSETRLLRTLVDSTIAKREVLHVEGRVAGYQLMGEGVRLHLQRVKVDDGKAEASELPELTLNLPKRSRMRLYRGRLLHVDGMPSELRFSTGVSELVFVWAYLREAQPLSNSWQVQRDSWVERLKARATFYLNPEPLSIFLPLTLAQRGYPSESQRMFRETGLAHLLAISGLHMAMIYGLLVTLFRTLGALRLTWLESAHFSNICRGLALLGLWAYLLLLGFPTPAFRAVVMLTALAAAWITGRSWMMLYVLAATAAGFVLLDPASLQDLSFQLSFLAVLHLLLFLPLAPKPNRDSGSLVRVGRFCGVSLLITAAATLGTWPLIATAFQQIPLEAFWLNLIMVPLLGAVVLPICLAVALLSAFHLGTLPFGWLEHLGYGLVELVLETWLGLLRTLHGWGTWATLEIKLEWSTWYFLGYYAVTVLGGGLVVRWTQNLQRIRNTQD